MNLYEVSRQYEEFMSAVEAGEIPEEAIGDTLESLEGEFEEKVDSVACLAKALWAESSAIKAEEKALEERRKAKEARAERMEEYLAQAMEKAGKLKLETARNKLSFRKSTGVYIEDEEDFKRRHMDLCRVETKVSIPRAELAKLLKAGRVIGGCELRERLNLQIK